MTDVCLTPFHPNGEAEQEPIVCGADNVPSRLSKFLIPVLITLLVSACDTPIGKTFSNLFEIQSVASELTGSSQVSVNVSNNTYITIRVSNSSLNDAAVTEREAVARRIAIRVYEVYEHRESLEGIAIAFQELETRYLVITTTKPVGVYKYQVSELLDDVNLPDQPGVPNPSRPASPDT